MAANPERISETALRRPTGVRIHEVPPPASPARSRWELRGWGFMLANAIGVGLAVIALELSWLDIGLDRWKDAYGIPFAFLWQGADAADSAFTLGRVLLAVALVGLVAIPLRATNVLRRLAVLALSAASIACIVQIVRWDPKPAADTDVGIGSVVILFGALLLLVQRSRKRKDLVG